MSSSSSSRTSSEPASPIVSKRKRKETRVADSDDSASDLDSSDAESTSDALVLSHAERRRQKKAEKLKLHEENVSKKRKLKDGTAIPVPAGKRQNSVWVGNMSFKTTQDNLRTFFEGVGEITRIYMPTKPAANPAMKPENRGFAYVDFETPGAKAAAIARSEQPLIGRKLLIKDGDDFTGRPPAPGADSTANGTGTSTTHSKTAQKILRAQKQPPAPTLFLGNLGFETTEQAIRQLFEAHRTVKKRSKDEPVVSDNEDEKKDKSKDAWIRKVRMGTFEDSGQCKGFAFVDFTSTEHATDALINPKNHHLNGRKLLVEYASADAVRRGALKVKREEGTGTSVPPKRRDLSARGSRPERPERRQPQDPSRSRETADQMAFTSTVGDSAKHLQGDDLTNNGIGRREKGPRVRPKPGAALALAKRESAAIVPSKGQKITF